MKNSMLIKKTKISNGESICEKSKRQKKESNRRTSMKFRLLVEVFSQGKSIQKTEETRSLNAEFNSH